MANSFSSRSTVVSGRQLIMDAQMPAGLTLTSLTLSGNLAVEWEVYIDRNISPLARIASISMADAGSGGTIPRDTTVYVRVTSIDIDGKESTPSVTGSKKTGSGSTNKIIPSWVAVTDAITYRVYAGTRSGMETLYAETAALTLDITSLPINASLSIPTTPDINIIAPLGALAVNVTGVPLSERLIIYAVVTTGGSVAVSCIAQ